MRAKIEKWGISVAIRIPRSLARQLALHVGKTVEVSVTSGRVVIAPAEEEVAYDLDRLIAGITSDNVHAETATGEAVGNEIA